MGNGNIIICAINLIGNICSILDFLSKLFGGGKPPKNGPTSGGKEITETISIKYIEAETALNQYSHGVKNAIVLKNSETGSYIALHYIPENNKFLAIGFFAYCSFKNKDDLPIWVGFQYSEFSSTGKPENLKFSIELLDREEWENAGIEKDAIMSKDYTSDNDDDAFCKSFDKTLGTTSIRDLEKHLKNELEEIAKLLG
jgi:hypothetical protein